MKPDKIDKLFGLARNENPPAASDDFADRVMRQIRGGELAQPTSFFDQINALVPRLALGASLLILLSIGADLVFSQFGSGDLDEEIARVSAQWLLP